MTNRIAGSGHMKGVGTAISSIIIIIIIIGLAFFFFRVLMGAENKIVEINLREAAILKTANTFYLTNKSLNMTWFISTVQTIFKAGETSLGVTYWYQKNKDGGLSTFRPGLDDLRTYMTNTMEVYKNGILKSTGLDPDAEPGDEPLPPLILLNDVEITVRNIVTTLEYDPLTIYFDENNFVRAVVTQELRVSYGGAESKGTTRYEYTIPTVFNALMMAGNDFIDAVKDFAGQTDSYKYTIETENSVKYLNDISSVLIADGGLFDKAVSMDGSAVRPVSSDFRLFPFELLVPNSDSNGIAILPDQGGLVLHYVALATIQQLNEGFYYHDEANELFYKKPFFLNVNALEYLEALDCSEYSSGQKFNYYNDNEDDMICYNDGSGINELYLCRTPIKDLITGMDSEHDLEQGDCLHNDPLPSPPFYSGAKGMECAYDYMYRGVFRECGTTLCSPLGCRSDADGNLAHFPEVICVQECDDVENPGLGCYCECPVVGPDDICNKADNICSFDRCNEITGCFIETCGDLGLCCGDSGCEACPPPPPPEEEPEEPPPEGGESPSTGGETSPSGSSEPSEPSPPPAETPPVETPPAPPPEPPSIIDIIIGIIGILFG